MALINSLMESSPILTIFGIWASIIFATNNSEGYQLTSFPSYHDALSELAGLGVWAVSEEAKKEFDETCGLISGYGGALTRAACIKESSLQKIYFVKEVRLP